MDARLTDAFDIDPHGRVVPNGDTARRALADRAGRFTVLPTSPDLLVAIRKPAAGGAAPRKRCSLSGDLSSFPIADLIAFIHQARRSGVLAVVTPGVERAVAFKQGDVRGARSTAPGERIGEVALRLGYVDAGQLAAAMAAPGPVGRALVERGSLSPSDLWKCLHEQVAGVFHAVLLAREGVFAMTEDPDADLGTPLSVSTQSLLMDGIRRVDEMSLFRTRIPDFHAYLRRRQPATPVALDRDEEQALALVDGRRRVEDVAKALHLDEFESTRIVYHLAEAGYLEAVADPMATPDGALGRTQAILAGVNDILRLIASDVARASSASAFMSGVRTFLADAEGRYAPLWRRVVPGRDGTVDGAVLLDNVGSLPAGALARLERSGDVSRVLFDGLRELLLFYLFQAGEVLPRAADERLHLEVKRRLDALGGLR